MQIKYTIYAYENVRGDSGLTKNNAWRVWG